MQPRTNPEPYSTHPPSLGLCNFSPLVFHVAGPGRLKRPRPYPLLQDRKLRLGNCVIAMQGFRILSICCRAVSGDASIAASSLACNARTCLLDAIFVMPAPVFHTLRTATTTFAPRVLEIFRSYLPIDPQVVPFWDYLIGF